MLGIQGNKLHMHLNLQKLQRTLSPTVEAGGDEEATAVKPVHATSCPIVHPREYTWQKHQRQRSRADYSIYTITSKEKAVVAVLVEAKVTAHSKFEHALGQVRFQSFCFRHSIRVSIVVTAPWLFQQTIKNLPSVLLFQRGVCRLCCSHTMLVEFLVLPELPLLYHSFRTCWAYYCCSVAMSISLFCYPVPPRKIH